MPIISVIKIRLMHIIDYFDAQKQFDPTADKLRVFLCNKKGYCKLVYIHESEIDEVLNNYEILIKPVITTIDGFNTTVPYPYFKEV